MSLVRRTLKWVGIALLVLVAVGMIGYLANKTYMDRYFRMAVSQARGQSACHAAIRGNAQAEGRGARGMGQ
jgi:hypothetical protein